MFQLDDKQTIDYLHRSYSVVDGLWFMKVEEKSGFEEALNIDKEVWKVLPKIQARMLKSIGNAENGLQGLLDCLKIKMTLDGFQFKVERDKNQSGFRIISERCPWLDLLIKSKRQHLSNKVGSSICNAEYSVWASEFGPDISFDLRSQICAGSQFCTLHFKSSSITT